MSTGLHLMPYAAAPSALQGGVSDVVTSGSLPVALAVALLAGLVSFASPCVLPLVPGFLGYVTGLGDVSLERRGRGRMLTGAVLFVLGFSAVYIVTLAFLASVGATLVEHRALLMRVGGAVVIVMALVFLGVGTRVGSQREVRLHARPAAGLAGAPLVGAAFGLGWAPCSGPTLGAIAILATTSDSASVSRGIALAVAYCLGLGLPFLLAAAAYQRFAPVSAFLRRRQRTLQVGGGVLLLAIGVLLLTGVWEDWTRLVQAQLVNGFTTVL